MKIILLMEYLKEVENNIYDDGDYFIGEYKNCFRNGKRIIYYIIENILYEGDFIIGKLEGNGKYICEDGKYYI